MYDVEHVGYKYHGNSITAAIGLVQLKYLDCDNSYRRQLARWYDELLNPYASKIKVIPQPNGCESTYHTYIIQVENRNELLLALNQAGIYRGVHYSDNTQYSMYAYGQNTCPHAHKISEQVISLPLHLYLSQKDIDYVCNQVIKYIEK
ncbi:DegT/DnrJ/EryC1/StrS family aminotransferase [Bacillus cereus]|uniref:Uncharacterized protein n=1 Tax=Bacillus cereus TaxID=1396 RepID=A0A9X7QMW4_BACCE|nr:DegT/DnrJ/EryC1/StrS family aminotransferase [Bacillus cereus]QDZ76960.1 hypothetical protein D0437_29645 [Bacillus cereus]